VQHRTKNKGLIKHEFFALRIASIDKIDR